MHAYHVINVEIVKVHVGQILPCGQVTVNKELRIGGLEDRHLFMLVLIISHVMIIHFVQINWEALHQCNIIRCAST